MLSLGLKSFLMIISQLTVNKWDWDCTKFLRLWVLKVLFFKDFYMRKWVNRTQNVTSELPFWELNHCPLLNVPLFILSLHSKSAMSMNDYLTSSETFYNLTLLEHSTWTLNDPDNAMPQSVSLVIKVQIILDMFPLRGWSLWQTEILKDRRSAFLCTCLINNGIVRIN